MYMKLFKVFLLLASLLLFFWGCSTNEQALQKASIHSSLGLNHLQQGDPTSALRELLEAERLNPNDPQTHYALGLAYSEKERFPQALEHFRQTLKLDPKYTEAHNAMGGVYIKMGLWEEAINEFEVVLKDFLYLTPFYVLNNMGWAYYKKGDRKSAIEYFKKAVAMKPNFGLAYYNLGLAYKDNQQLEEAIAALRSAVGLASNFLGAHFQLGLLYFNSGKRGEAEKSFQAVVRIAPQSESARLAQQYLDLLKKPAN